MRPAWANGFPAIMKRSLPLMRLHRQVAIAALLAACMRWDHPVHGAETPSSVEFRGSLVCLAEAMHQAFQVDLPTSHTHVPGFQTKDNRYYTLLRTKQSEALFADPVLQRRNLLLNGRVFPGTQILDVTLIRSVHNDVVHDLYYWCDVCAIKSVIPGECMCCQEDVVLQEIPAGKDTESPAPSQ
jgi:hypothetical protein